MVGGRARRNQPCCRWTLREGYDKERAQARLTEEKETIFLGRMVGVRHEEGKGITKYCGSFCE